MKHLSLSNLTLMNLNDITIALSPSEALVVRMHGMKPLAKGALFASDEGAF